jgi:uncharacterized protein (TIGR00661 family)
LDWGLGHATRCIPIIKALLEKGFEVLIATDGLQQSLLQEEFPQLKFLPLKGYRVTYSKNKWLFPFKIFVQVPKILLAIKNENQWLNRIVDSHHIDIVISDNRFGLHHKKIKSIFITHQLTIKAPFLLLEKWLQKINYYFINQFTSCCVPDIKGEINVAGILSHPVLLPKIPVHYIGLLSRFEKMDPVQKKYDYCIVLSGPEPQRTLFENIIVKDINNLEGKILLVRGKPGSDTLLKLNDNIAIANHLSGNLLQQAFLQSEMIICRSGYTTVMELLSLQKKSILVPTPGQTEQEYLAQILMQQQIGFSVQQHVFELLTVIKEARSFLYTTKTYPVFTKIQLEQALL